MYFYYPNGIDDLAQGFQYRYSPQGQCQKTSPDGVFLCNRDHAGGSSDFHVAYSRWKNPAGKFLRYAEWFDSDKAPPDWMDDHKNTIPPSGTVLNQGQPPHANPPGPTKAAICGAVPSKHLPCRYCHGTNHGAKYVCEIVGPHPEHIATNAAFTGQHEFRWPNGASAPVPTKAANEAMKKAPYMEEMTDMDLLPDASHEDRNDLPTWDELNRRDFERLLGKTKIRP